MLLSLQVAAQTRPLNDTGQVTCYSNSGTTGNVSSAVPDPEASGFNQQDCTLGRAAADALGILPKTGASRVAGRDYTKIANDGSELPTEADLGSEPRDWACTRDNVTGLIWEVKVNDVSSLRHFDHGYKWYDANNNTNGGFAGSLGTAITCNGTLANCNTAAFRDAVNALAGSNRLCGATDWRIPSDREMQSLADYAIAPTQGLDPDWFPNASGNLFLWTGVNYASDSTRAWYMTPWGYLGSLGKHETGAVRLVRGGL